MNARLALQAEHHAVAPLMTACIPVQMRALGIQSKRQLMANVRQLACPSIYHVALQVHAFRTLPGARIYTHFCKVAAELSNI